MTRAAAAEWAAACLPAVWCNNRLALRWCGCEKRRPRNRPPLCFVRTPSSLPPLPDQGGEACPERSRRVGQHLRQQIARRVRVTPLPLHDEQRMPAAYTSTWPRALVTDDKGRKVAVQIDLTKHRELWEDLQDVLVSRSRRHEKRIPLDKVKAGLIKTGKLPRE